MWELNHEVLFFFFLMKINFKKNYLNQELTIFHLEGDVFHCISMLNQVLPDFWGVRTENRNPWWTNTTASPLSFKRYNEGTYLHYQDLVEKQRQKVSKWREGWCRISDRWSKVFIWSKQKVYQPCPVWWHETPPHDSLSPNPCRPKAQSPSCHSRRRLPMKS